jgi:hypothetical protein
MSEYKKKPCPEWLKEAYRRAVHYICQGCHKPEVVVGKLEIHRIIRGNIGGTYEPNNCQILCKKCHRVRHQGEF